MLRVHLQRDVVEHDRLAHAGEHVLDDRRQRRHVVGSHRRQDRELVAAEARDQPALADPLGQSRPEVGQQIVAVLVAECVVDVLEVVEVEQHHAECRGRSVGLSDLGVDAVAELLAVGEPRELVGGRHDL